MDTNIKALKHAGLFIGIDHVAIAVKNLRLAIPFYRDVLGLDIIEERQTLGKYSGMVSAVLSAGTFTIVLIEGTNQESQVSRYIEHYGMGVQHLALAVENIDAAILLLKANGIEFVTEVIQGSGLKQIFSERDKNSGMMFEIIERTGEAGFQDSTVQSLFDQLENKGVF
jgi:methylmalonyl-CoA/ethylmalonyl-CoA epimerase